jgi:hypothetical protein
VLRWTGDVDDALEIRIQGNRIDYRTLNGKSVRNVRADVGRGGLPRNDVQVFVTDVNGRGSVSVVQQPSSYNGYTAVIRVYDPRPGMVTTASTELAGQLLEPTLIGSSQRSTAATGRDDATGAVFVIPSGAAERRSRGIYCA